MAWLDITSEGELKSKERSSWINLQRHNDPSQPRRKNPRSTHQKSRGDIPTKESEVTPNEGVNLLL
jgi:hypothetical protein